MKIGLDVILSIGMHEENNLGFNQRLRKYNAFIFFGMIVAFIYGVLVLNSSFRSISIVFFGISLLFLTTLFLHHQRKYYLSRFIVLVTTCLTLLSLGIIFGPNANYQVYFFASPLVIFSVYTFYEKRGLIISSLFFIASFIFLEYLEIQKIGGLLHISEEAYHFFSVINYAFTFFFVFLLTGSFSSFYLSFANRIKKKNVELEVTKSQLMNVISEKNVLLAETHHRVKNNLAMISGIFDLQLMIEKNKTNKDLLIKSKHRIKSMSLVHELLYQNNNLAEIELDTYIQKLISTLQELIPSDKVIRFQLDLAKLPLDLSRAISLGLIINEVVTNAVKHAFTQQQDGTIALELKQVDSDYTLRIQDNGSGFSPDEVPSESSIGHELIEALSAQLEAQSAFQQKEGTCFTLIFPAHG